MLQGLARFGQEPRILQCNDRLRCEIFEKRNLFAGERPHLATKGRDGPKKHVIFAQGHNQESPNTALGGDPRSRIVRALSGYLPDIIYVDERLAFDKPGKRVAWAGKKAVPDELGKLDRRVTGSRRPEAFSVIGE